MQRLRLVVVLVCLTEVAAYAARQNTGQRLHSKIAVAGQQPKLLFPRTSGVDLSALAMERDDSGTMTHLKGDVEIRLSYGVKVPTIVVKADEAVYNAKTGEIETRGELKISTEK